MLPRNKKRQVGLVLPIHLVERIDKQVQATYRTRTEFIRQALEEKLEKEEEKNATTNQA